MFKTLTTVKDGFYCDAGLTSEGWFAAVTIIPDTDETYLKEYGRRQAVFKDPRDEPEWSRAYCENTRRLLLVQERNGRISEEPLSEAERIDGPTVCAGGTPAVVWTERLDGAWNFLLWKDGERKVLLESERVIRSPCLAQPDGDLVCACECSDASGGTIQIMSEGGEHLLTHRGRYPRLAPLADGKLLFLYEDRGSGEEAQKRGLESIGLAVGELDEERTLRYIELPSAEDYNLHAGMTADKKTGRVFIVWESCPAWGYDTRLDLHRDINLWVFEPGADSFRPFAWDGKVPIPLQAGLDKSNHNLAPLQPRVFLIEGSPAVVYRRFRFQGNAGFGWDVFVIRFDGRKWLKPQRMTENVGPPETGHTVLHGDGRLYTAAACCDQKVFQTFAERAAGKSLDKETSLFAHSFRIEIIECGVDDTLPANPVPPERWGSYLIPPPVHDLAPEPPDLIDPPENLTLLWGDLHVHSCYSKCFSVGDGSPEENIQLQRDAMGCTVLTITDHLEDIGAAELTHVMDRCEIEAEAGKGSLFIYATEWARKPAHDMIFYARSRAVFDKLRGILAACGHLTDVYARIKSELPADSVFAARHQGGGRDEDEFGINGPRVVETWDPDLELVGQCVRGQQDALMDPGALFPKNFLNAGIRFGLIGGTDHQRDKSVHRYCLTGIWVSDFTVDAVFEAIKDRRTVAASSGKVAMFCRMNGEPMGREVTVRGEAVISASLSCAKPIKRICLMRDGELLPWKTVDARVTRVELEDPDPVPGYHWYVVNAEAENLPEEPLLTAHSSPFFVTVE